MNGNIRWFTIAFFSILTAVSGCNDTYDITTILNPDGSCERIITCAREAMTLPEGAFPLPVGPSWDTSWTEETKGEKKQYIYTARKRYANPDSLIAEFTGRRDSASFTITLEVEKRFRWFYTYFTYHETYARFNPLYSLAPTTVMTEEEVRRFMSEPRPDSLLQEKWKMWEKANEEEFFFARLRKLLEGRTDLGLSPSELDARHREIVAAWEGDSAGRSEKAAEVAAHAARSLAKVFRNEKLLTLQPAIERIVEEFFAAVALQGKANGLYRTAAVLPGTLLETNAPEIDGNRVAWTFTQDQIAIGEIVMSAESRMLNFWALLVTAVAALGVLLGPAVARIVKRDRPPRVA